MDIVILKKIIAIIGIIVAFFMIIPYDLFEITRKYDNSIRWALIGVMALLVIIRYFILE